MTAIYKLTDEHDQTMHVTQWGAGVYHEVSGTGELCSSGWLHAYTNPLLAVLLNPIHADFANPHLWVANGSGNFKSDCGLKVGYAKITTLERMELPAISQTQMVAFGILCTLEVYHDPAFIEWANGWLDGSDRSLDAVRAAGYADAARAATTTAYAAADVAYYYAAYAAAGCAGAAYAAYAAAGCAAGCAGYAYAAAYAAYAAATAAATDAADIDLVALAERAMAY